MATNIQCDAKLRRSSTIWSSTGQRWFMELERVRNIRQRTRTNHFPDRLMYGYNNLYQYVRCAKYTEFQCYCQWRLTALRFVLCNNGYEPGSSYCRVHRSARMRCRRRFSRRASRFTHRRQYFAGDGQIDQEDLFVRLVNSVLLICLGGRASPEWEAPLRCATSLILYNSGWLPVPA